MRGSRLWPTLAAAAALVLGLVLYLGSCATRDEAAHEQRHVSSSAGETADTEQPAWVATQESGSRREDASAGEVAAPTAETVLAQMREARDCYQDPNCHIDDAGPRDHYYRAGKAVAEGLRELRARHRAGALGDAKLAAAAREFIGFDNPHTQSEALAAFAQIAPSPGHLAAITKALDGSAAARLFEPALAEFERYDSPTARRRIEAFLQSNLRTGAHRSAQTIARNLIPFLTSDNVDTFAAIADELRAGSRRAELIRSAIDEFRRR
jgi:hypothetical protein